MKSSKLIALLLFVFFSNSIFSQEVVYLYNPSFEDIPRHSRVPTGWQNCGWPGESPPDVQPGQFDVYNEAVHGNTYLGMVTRENGTWESIGQKLDGVLKKNQTYKFSIYLTRSETYLSPSRSDSLSMLHYVVPVKLKIWGNYSMCERAEVLAESSLIVSPHWYKYSFTIRPTLDYEYICFDVYFKEPTDFKYAGNLLLDHASHFIPIDETTEDTLAVPDPEYIAEAEKKWESIIKQQQRIIARHTAQAKARQKQVKEYTPTEREQLKELKKLIKVKGVNLTFNQNGDGLTEKSQSNLELIIKRLQSLSENYRLIVAFHENVPNTDEKTAIFLDYFDNQKLTEADFTIREWKELDHRRKWYADTGEIRLGLAEKNK